MKKIISFAFLIITITIINGQSPKAITEHFIVIGVDGMSPDGIMCANTPVMDNLMKNGSYTLKARSVLPTSSSTNWASMMMGAGPEQHGITSNGWEKDDYVLPPVVKGEEGIFPTIFSVIKSQRPNSELGAIYHWTDFGRLFEKKPVDYDTTGDNELETTQLVCDYVRSRKPIFLFIQLDHVDHAGHEYGHGTEKYYRAVELADTLIGRIVQSAKDAGIFENTTFLVTADHGGIGYGHGGETIDEIEIPFILFGKGIKENYLIQHPVYTYDNAATVAVALGVNQPYAWIGRAVKSAFIGEEIPVTVNEKVMLPSPVIYPGKKFYSPAGGLFIDKTPVLKIESEIIDAEIRYTLDGSEPTKTSILYIKPVEIKKSAVVQAKVFKGKNEESYSSTAFFRLVDSKSDNRIKYKYYELGDGINSLPIFDNLSPVSEGEVYEFRISDINKKDAAFAIKYESKISITKSGKYKFYSSSDDGSKVLIDEKLVVDNDGDHGTRERSGSIELAQGLHDISVEYFNGGGGSWLEVFYRGPGIPKQIIPPDVLLTGY